MKKIITILCLAMTNTIHAQEIIERRDTNQVISLLTSTAPLQLEPMFCSVNASVLIPKDTITSNLYILSFFYNTPKEILLDTTAEIEIRFSDGGIYTFNNARNSEEITPKDSSVSFQLMVSYNCLNKMTEIPVSEISFVSPLYTHRIEIEDKMKLYLPNLARYILDKSDEEYLPILNWQRSLNAPAIVFDSRANKQLDKKYLGKYSGEWYRDEYLYNYDLYIKSDTSYIDWYIVKDPYENDPQRIKTQVLNIRTITENNTLIMDVCYEADKSDYTGGRRTFYLKLSENGKVIYGMSEEFNRFFANMYGVRKETYRK
jgi:hypothetical protein